MYSTHSKQCVINSDGCYLLLPDSVPIDEFLNYPEEERTYEILDSDGLIEELIDDGDN